LNVNDFGGVPSSLAFYYLVIKQIKKMTELDTNIICHFHTIAQIYMKKDHSFLNT